MAWWHIKPRVTKDFKELAETYNEKYGDYDYKLDSRSLDTTFEKVFLDSVGDITDKKVIVCGSNAGYEIEILFDKFPTTKFTAVDVSNKALEKLRYKFPEVSCIHANMESLPFQDKGFDIYINCRAIHSTDVNIEVATKEAIRVTKGKIILSISNGYRIEDAIQNGMYDYDSEKIDKDKPLKIINELKDLFNQYKYKLIEIPSEAELFIIAEPV